MAADGAADRLSGLPQPVWTKILSLLPSRDAVTTGLLSRRWQQIPNLDFDPASFVSRRRVFRCQTCFDSDCTATRFAAFVDMVLPACVVRRSLRRLCLRPSCQCNHWMARIDRWVCLAMAARCLESLELDFSWLTCTLDLGASVIDSKIRHIPVTETLAELRLRHCCFDPRGFYPFTALKALTLASVTLHVVAPLFECCPSLEILTMRDCFLMESLKIRHDRLRRLDVKSTRFCLVNHSMEVEAPELETVSVTELFNSKALVLPNPLNLVSLVVENCYAGEDEALGTSLEIGAAPRLSDFRFVGAVGKACSVFAGVPAQLGDVDIDVSPSTEVEDEHNSWWVRELLKGVSTARSLMFVGPFIEHLSTKLDPHVALPVKFNNLKTLTLIVSLVPEALPGIACLLRSSPFLQTLSIVLDKDYQPDGDYMDAMDLSYELEHLEELYGDYWESQESPIDCLVHHVTRIEIWDYRGTKIQEELARYLATSAAVLEEMPVSTPTTTFSGFDFF